MLVITGLPVFWSTPNAKEVEDFVWDTDVPQVTEPWPHMEFHRFSLSTVVHALTGRVDPTNYLYELAELEAMLKAVPVEDADTTILEAVQ